MRTRYALLLIPCLLLSACGGSKESASGGAVPLPKEQASSFTAQQVVDALKLTDDPNSDNEPTAEDPAAGLWDAGGQCTVAVVLTSPSDIDTYASAGDPVASNPSRTAGVKIGTYAGADVEQCHTLFTKRLATLK